MLDSSGVVVAATATPIGAQGRIAFLDAVQACQNGHQISQESTAEGPPPLNPLVPCSSFNYYAAVGTATELFVVVEDQLRVIHRATASPLTLSTDMVDEYGLALVKNQGQDLIVYHDKSSQKLKYKRADSKTNAPGAALTSEPYGVVASPAFDGSRLFFIDEAGMLRVIELGGQLPSTSHVSNLQHPPGWTHLVAGDHEVLAIADDVLVRAKTPKPGVTLQVPGWTLTPRANHVMRSAAYAPDGIGWIEEELDNDAGTPRYSAYFRAYCDGAVSTLFEHVSAYAAFLAIDARAIYYADASKGIVSLAR